MAEAAPAASSRMSVDRRRQSVGLTATGCGTGGRGRHWMEVRTWRGFLNVNLAAARIARLHGHALLVRDRGPIANNRLILSLARKRSRRRKKKRLASRQPSMTRNDACRLVRQRKEFAGMNGPAPSWAAERQWPQVSRANSPGLPKLPYVNLFRKRKPAMPAKPDGRVGTPTARR